MKVVRRIRYSVQALPIQPNTDDVTSSNVSHRGHRDQKQCERYRRNEQEADESQQQQREDQGKNKTGENQNRSHIHCVMVHGTLPNTSTSESRSLGNSSHQVEPNTVDAIIHREEVACRKRTGVVPQCHIRSPSKGPWRRSLDSGGARKLAKETLKNKCKSQPEQSLDQIRKRVVAMEHVKENNSPTMEIQMNILGDQQPYQCSQNEISVDGNVSRERKVHRTQRLKEKEIAFISRITHSSSQSKKPSGMEIPKINQEGKIEVSTNLEMKIILEKAKTTGIVRQFQVQPNEEINNEDGSVFILPGSCHENRSECKNTDNQHPELQPGNDVNGIRPMSQNRLQEADHNEHGSEVIERHQQDERLPPMEGYPRKKRRPLGKTQRRLAKLLKEGKAAIDVIIIIGFFVLSYLPLWIMGCYRAFGGDPSAEVILTTHCFYATTMVWNPIIYSIRKKEFREAVRKLMKL